MLAKPLLCAFAATSLLCSGAVAQEAKPEQKVEQKIPGVDTKPLLDNEQMKVFEVRFKPGATTPALSHANRFVYALTDGSLVFSPAGKTPYELTFKTGEALWLPADETMTKNDTDRDVRTLVVEVKAGSRAAPGAVMAKAKGGKGKATARRSGRRGGKRARS